MAATATRAAPGLTSAVGCTSDAPVVKNGDEIRVGNFKARVGDNLLDMLDATAHKNDPDQLLKCACC